MDNDLNNVIAQLERFLRKRKTVTLNDVLEELLKERNACKQIHVSREWIKQLINELQNAPPSPSPSASPSPSPPPSQLSLERKSSSSEKRRGSRGAISDSPMMTRSAKKELSFSSNASSTTNSPKVTRSTSSSRANSRKSSTTDLNVAAILLTPISKRVSVKHSNGDEDEESASCEDDEEGEEEGTDSQLRSSKTKPKNVIVPKNGNYSITVRGWWEGSGDLCVDLALIADPSRMKRNLMLKAKILQTQNLLDNWATDSLGIPCSSKFTKKDGLRQEATTIATTFDGRPTPKKLACFGRQEVDGDNIFALSEDIVLSQETGENIAGECLFELDSSMLKKAPIIPLPNTNKRRNSSLSDVESSSEGQPRFASKNALKEWIQCWNKQFNGVHLAELIVGIAHAAMCMKRLDRKPSLIYFGTSDCGKTQLMSYLAEMFGFDGGNAMLSSVTEAALWDRLHYLSGLPTFCNDAKWETKQIKVLKDHIIPVYDGTAHSVSGNTRQANGYVVASLNDKRDSVKGEDGPLEKLLDQESNWNRLVLCPVRDLTGERVTVPANWRPSVNAVPSSAVLKQLLSIPMVMAGSAECEVLADQRFPGRLGEIFADLSFYVEEICDIAKLTKKQIAEVEMFMEENMVDAINNYQCGSKERFGKAQIESILQFKVLVQKRFFKPDGTLVSWNERSCSVGKGKKPIIQTKLNVPGVYYVRIRDMYNELCQMSGTWKKSVPSVETLINYLVNCPSNMMEDCGFGNCSEKTLLDPTEDTQQAEAKNGVREGKSVKMRKLFLGF